MIIFLILPEVWSLAWFTNMILNYVPAFVCCLNGYDTIFCASVVWVFALVYSIQRITLLMTAPQPYTGI